LDVRRRRAGTHGPGQAGRHSGADAKNNASSRYAHNIDLHAVNGPGGGAAATTAIPGQEAAFQFKALNPGLYVYHCAVPPAADHIANGMYGLILVEPPAGMTKADKEFYVVQGDFYTQGKLRDQGFQAYSRDKMLAEQPEYVVFNGSDGSLTGGNALKASVGDLVRIYFGNGGPNLASSFHVIGEVFDRVYPEGATSPVLRNVQTTLVPADGSAVVEFLIDVPGTYILVDHAISRTERGAIGQIVAEGQQKPDIYQKLKSNTRPAAGLHGRRANSRNPAPGMLRVGRCRSKSLSNNPPS
jgi:nitrite reductase (NO-forming)